MLEAAINDINSPASIVDQASLTTPEAAQVVVEPPSIAVTPEAAPEVKPIEMPQPEAGGLSFYTVFVFGIFCYALYQIMKRYLAKQ